MASCHIKFFFPWAAGLMNVVTDTHTCCPPTPMISCPSKAHLDFHLAHTCISVQSFFIYVYIHILVMLLVYLAINPILIVILKGGPDGNSCYGFTERQTFAKQEIIFATYMKFIIQVTKGRQKHWQQKPGKLTQGVKM